VITWLRSLVSVCSSTERALTFTVSVTAPTVQRQVHTLAGADVTVDVVGERHREAGLSAVTRSVPMRTLKNS
jgi:hypothetical protein